MTPGQKKECISGHSGKGLSWSMLTCIMIAYFVLVCCENNLLKVKSISTCCLSGQGKIP